MATFYVGDVPVRVDADCLPLLGLVDWHIDAHGYVRAWLRPARGKRKILLLHREIMKAPPGLCVDHINGDPLDNRRANLRLCTHAQNMKNRRLHRNNTSGFKGVWRRRNRWRAEIKVEGQRISLGTFATIEEAAAAYAEGAHRFHGEFARIA